MVEGGEGIHPQVLLNNGFLDTPMFVVTTNGLQLSIFTVVATKYFLLHKPKSCKLYHNFNLILSVLNN